MDKAEALKKAVAYAALIVEKYNPATIVLYGSYSKENAHEDSDIDIAVICDNVGDGWLEQSHNLYKLRRNIDPHIEPILLEVNSDRSGFVEEILKTGKILYSRKA